MGYILHFKEIDRQSLSLVGGKGANLGEMVKAGFRVPFGFCVTTEAYRDAISELDEMDQWLDNLNKLNLDQLDEVYALGQKVRNHISSLTLSEFIKEAIVTSWKEFGEDHAYAVRSSATAEDLPGASFAGQQETYLNVKGDQQLLEAVKSCWASLFTNRAIVYRIKNGFDHKLVSLSVVVQQMIFPEVSGIMFTADPVTGHRHTVSIDAGFGLGEALVSGIVTADLYKVRDREIIHKQIAEKEKGVFPIISGGTEVRELPPEMRKKQVLSDQKILELAKLGRKIESHYGLEQDIEWCLKDDDIYILQSRPITSLYPIPSRKNDEYRIYLSIGHSQMMTDYMEPLGVSVFQSLFPLNNESIPIVEAGGRLFVDCSTPLFLKSVQRKIFNSTFPDSNLVALKKVLQSQDFMQLAPRRGVMRKALGLLKNMMFLFRRIIPGIIRIWYWEDPNLAGKRAFARFEKDLIQLQRTLSQHSGASRIRFIQEHPIFNTVAHPVTYVYSGLIALQVIKRKLKKWLLEEWSNVFEKSPSNNITSEMGLMIGDLADALRPYPKVVLYLEQAKDQTFYEGLSKVEGGDVFRVELDKFMEKFGMRASGEIDITRPRYKEAPSMLVASILSHMRSNAPQEHWEKFNQGKQEAAEAIQSLIARVKETPGGSRKTRKLNRFFALYRNTVGIRELPKYILIRHLQIYRESILEEAETLVEKKMLEHKEDVFYFTLDELTLLLKGDLKKDEVVELIDSRKTSEEVYSRLTPPLVITSKGEIFSGIIHNEQAPPGALVGIPVSAGVVEGYVKVVRRLQEGKLNKGDILVAPYTDPGWTPLFHSAKALVTEVGGMMTHGSVVAREYGMPAVVSVKNATQLLKDGQYVRVDGTNGYVEILEDKLE